MCCSRQVISLFARALPEKNVFKNVLKWKKTCIFSLHIYKPTPGQEKVRVIFLEAEEKLDNFHPEGKIHFTGRDVRETLSHPF